MNRAGAGRTERRSRGLPALRATAGSMPNVRTAGEVPSRPTPARFRALVWRYWKKDGRHDLPWRKTKDPYRILVSEVMLQQTQVPRVIDKYKEFLKKFPTVRALAKASLSDVLKVWSGLGYNRRGKYLHDAAKEIVEKYGGKVPQDFAALRTLSGVGGYTASAVRVFAFNEPNVLIETNIRTAFIHYFHSNVLQNVRISDVEIIPLATLAAQGQEPREWHWALMDYGAHLKCSGVRNNNRSAHYTKQSKFEGSLRQVRGAILRELHRGKQPRGDASRLRLALAGLLRDGLIVKVRPRRIGLGPKKGRRPEGSARRGKWRIA